MGKPKNKLNPALQDNRRAAPAYVEKWLRSKFLEDSGTG